MSSHQSTIYLFGDQAFLSKDDLRKLLLVNHDQILNDFTDQAAFHLRQEIQSLPWNQREKLPVFANLLDLLALDAKADKPLHPALFLAISTAQHIATYILHRTSALKELSGSDVCYTFGFGSGLLASAAVTCHPDPRELVAVGLQMVRIAFRVGLLATEMKSQVSPDLTSNAPWRVNVATTKDLTPEAIEGLLERFAAEKELLPWARPYSFGGSDKMVLVGGAPDLVAEFMETYQLTPAPGHDAYAPFMAPHLYSEHDVDRILQSFPEAMLENSTSKFTRLNKPSGNSSLKSQLRQGIATILRGRITWEDALAQISASVKAANHASTTTVSIGTHVGSRLPAMIGGEATHVGTKDIMALLPASGKTRQPKIAITGFSGRFPRAQNLEQFWDVLHGGVDTHSVVPPTRWDVDTHVDPALKRKNTSATPYGCWLDEPGLFDRSFFSISPREAPIMDPAQRLALMCAYEAIEMAGIVPDATPSTVKSRVGVFIGVTSNDWCETNSAQDVDFYFIPGGNRAFIPGRINYFFKFSGPSYSVDTACSSSMAAIHLACNALWRGEVDTAIVGGTNILTNPDVTAGLDRGHFLSRTGNCKSFDDGADGYCRGEGVGVMVLKRLDDAQAENDTIYASILSAGTNHSAEAESITRPHVGAQQALFSHVLAMAGVEPNDIDYVEMHGTGTQAGDGREMTSVYQTFAPFPPNDPRGRQTDLYVGSVKSNVGHGEAVSGVTAITKILLMLEKNEIVPHCGIKNKINQTFPADLDERRIKIAREATPWMPGGKAKPRRVLVNNFSAAGGNTCLLLEEPPEKPKRTTLGRYDNRPAHVVTVSAKTKMALEANLKAMAQYLQTCHSVPLADISYTSTARRVHYNFRASFVAGTVRDMYKAVSAEASSPAKQFRGPPKMIFCFSGQGSNHPGMAKSLYDRYATFRTELDRFDSIVQGFGFGSVLPYLVGTDGEAAQAAAPLIVQLSHVCLQMSLGRLWKSWGVNPAASLGHSLGEYAALNLAGVLSDFDTIWVCGRRAQLLAEHCKTGTHSMMALRSSHEEVKSHLDDVAVEIACINGAQETVVSGPLADIDEAAKKFEAQGIRAHRVNLPYAFHSSQVEPILDDLDKIVSQVDMRTPTVPLISPLDGEVIVVGGVVSKDYLTRQCRESVNLLGAVSAGQTSGLLDERAHLLELGPSLVLSRLVKRTLGAASPAMVIPSLNPDQESSQVLAGSVATAYRVGVTVNWAQYHHDYEHGVVRLPSYSWDLKNYWMQYVHDWSLRKGDPLPIAAAAPSFDLATTACQKVVKADRTADKLHLVVESNLQTKELRPVVAGHTVNGIAVCIGAVYADMAKSCGDAILRAFQADPSTTAVLVNDMNMLESIVVSETSDSQIVTIEAKCDWKAKKADISVSSGKKVNATATVVFVDRQAEKKAVQKDLKSSASHIALVKDAAADGEAERFTTSMAYRMVASLAHYDPTHKGVKECTLNSETMEACALVATKAQHRLAGSFGMHPCVFDNILQIATFVLNANENSRFDQEVYVVRGWDSAFLDETLDDSKQYETYVKMDTRDKEVATGDIAVLCGGNVIGRVKGVRVQRVPRRLMDVMFRPKGQAAAPAAAPKPAASSSSTPAVTVTPSAPAPAAAPASAPASGSQDLQKALSIVAEESGHSLEEFKDDDQLADLGIDSLLNLVIVSRFREELDIDLHPTFFMEITSIGALKQYFGEKSSDADSQTDSDSAGPSNSPSRAEPASGVLTPPSDISPHDSGDEGEKKARLVKTTSVVLQGKVTPGKPTMFLFPDGSGSATSYVNLPRVDKDIAVVAINCPYMTRPHEMVGTFEDITAILLAEARRRQPHGPYRLGGWSAGGAFAYCATQMLQAAGEEVESLVLIDAPCPVGLGKLPQIFFDFWKTIHEPGGPVADRPIPHWLMDHFQAVNKNLRGFTASPMPKGKSPRTYVVWAARGTDNLEGFKKDRHLLTEAESEDLGFLMDDKTDFGPRGWEALIEGDLTIEKAMTSNHFTIMRGDGAKVTAGLIKKACFA